jgi:hypothetical protein
MAEFVLLPMECIVFHSFLRLRCALPEGVRPLSVVLTRDGQEVSLDRQKLTLSRPTKTSLGVFEIEAIIDREAFPDHYAVQIGLREEQVIIPCRDITDQEQHLYAKTIMPQYQAMLTDWIAANPGRRPKLLDIGGRARSGYRHTVAFQQCDVTVMDIIEDESVDIVSDIHRMSEDLGEDRFDFAICISVFEHLLMPWKAALEINKVLKSGGLLLVQTHQTTGMHDLPWDYYRFSDESWKGLFNKHTGFKLEASMMSSFQNIVPMHYYAAYTGFEGAGGFNDSSVIVRKIGATELAWPVELRDIIHDNYPG